MKGRRRVTPQNRRTDSRPYPLSFRETAVARRTARVAPSIGTWVSVFPDSAPPRPRNGETHNFLISQRDNAVRVRVCVRAPDTFAYPPIYVTAGWIIMCPIGSCRAHPPRYRAWHVVLSARTYTHTREIAPTHRGGRATA